MALSRYRNLKRILAQLKPGQAVTTHWLMEHGVSAQLAHHYVKAGWLTRLGHGYFIRTGDEPDLLHSLAALPFEFHVGGKTALEWHGYRHNLTHRSLIVLFSNTTSKLPLWMRKRFSIVVRRRRLFEKPNLSIESWRELPSLRVSEPERAVLEMLWEVPQHQSIEDATHLVEGLYGLRPNFMQPLLESCRSIKAIRIFLHLAKQVSLPVLNDLNLDKINRGSATPYVRKQALTTIRF